jgi:hypothetical protein
MDVFTFQAAAKFAYIERQNGANVGIARTEVYAVDNIGPTIRDIINAGAKGTIVEYEGNRWVARPAENKKGYVLEVTKATGPLTELALAFLL